MFRAIRASVVASTAPAHRFCHSCCCPLGRRVCLPGSEIGVGVHREVTVGGGSVMSPSPSSFVGRSCACGCFVSRGNGALRVRLLSKNNSSIRLTLYSLTKCYVRGGRCISVPSNLRGTSFGVSSLSSNGCLLSIVISNGVRDRGVFGG